MTRLTGRHSSDKQLGLFSTTRRQGREDGDFRTGPQLGPRAIRKYNHWLLAAGVPQPIAAGAEDLPDGSVLRLLTPKMTSLTVA
jgi:hypothetical protein